MRVRVSRVVLVGLSGSGKTTVGELLADRLGWAFRDTDREVSRRSGLDIAAIFRERGEAGFRRLELDAVAEAVADSRIVVAPGAGWAAQPGALDALPAGTVVVWLQVEVATAASRLALDPTERPLLARTDMAARLIEQHAVRAPAYRRADVVVDTSSRTPEAVAREIEARLIAGYGIDGRSD